MAPCADSAARLHVQPHAAFVRGGERQVRRFADDGEVGFESVLRQKPRTALAMFLVHQPDENNFRLAAGAPPEFARSHSAPNMAATEPLVSHAPRPYIRPPFGAGVNCVRCATFTVSRCGASRMVWRIFRRGAAGDHIGRPGKTF